MTAATSASGRRSGVATRSELRRWLDALAETTRAVNRGLPLDELLGILATTTCHLTGYTHCAVLLRDDPDGFLRIHGSHGLSRSYVESINERYPISARPGELGQGPSSRAFRTERPVTLTDILADPTCDRFEPLVAAQGVASLASLPIAVNGTTLGVLNCYTATRHRFGADEVVLLQTVANQAAAAIEANRLRTGERARIEELERLNDQLRSQRRSLQRARRAHEELMRVLLEDHTPEAVAGVLGSTLGSSICLEDAQGRLLATGGALDPETARERLCRPDLAEAAATLDRERRLVDLPAPGPRKVEAAMRGGDAAIGGRDTSMCGGDAAIDSGEAAIGVPVLLAGEVAGRLWAWRAEPLDDFERRDLESGAVVVAVAMQGMRMAREIEWRLSRDFIDELLAAADTADPAQADGLLDRGRHLGVELAEPHAVLVVRLDAAAAGEIKPVAARAHVMRQLLSSIQRVADGFPEAHIAAARSDHVMLLWSASGGPGRLQEVAEGLRRDVGAYGPPGTVTVVVSAPCSSPAQYRPAYRAAKTALDLAQRAGSDRVVQVPDLGVLNLLMHVEDAAELTEFARGRLGPLRAYDARCGAHLAETLRTYIEQRCSTARTAESLFVHHNTVTYRLSRVRDLTGCDPASLDTLLEYQLAFLIEQLVGPVGAGSPMPG
ncbi:MAG: helix-turn-helix domain-containing protein [Acidimicrobiales bacterium]